MNCKLDAAYNKEEVEIALKQMAPLKAPKPDGFGAGFYQKHWKIVREDVSAAMIKILEEEGMNSILNHTFIALIPKV